MFEDNWPILETFLRCGTQWQHAGMDGVRVGLHYPGVETVLRLTVAEEQRRAVFDGIQVMERAALEEFARQATERARRANR